MSDEFLDECMGVEDFQERMELLWEDRARLVLKISAILPRLGKPELFNQLNIMRDRHKCSIETLDRLLKLKIRLTRGRMLFIS